MPIENISDTARWVAVYRAMETEKPDAIFRDPYARKLAGAKGEEIVRNMQRGRSIAWSVIVRTALFDEMIMQRVNAGVDMVINLAAGLDTRPWRLPLPSSLRWIDVDLPDILQYKTDMLADAKPACRYEAVHADLTNADERDAVFARLGAEGKSVLVSTEGLLIYLAEPQVGGLAAALHAQRGFRWWVFDMASPRLLAMMQKSWGANVGEGNAAFQFAPASGAAFFNQFGWREVEFRSSMTEARRLNREMPMMWLWRWIAKLSPAARRDEMERMYGIVMLERT